MASASGSRRSCWVSSPFRLAFSILLLAALLRCSHGDVRASNRAYEADGSGASESGAATLSHTVRNLLGGTRKDIERAHHGVLQRFFATVGEHCNGYEQRIAGRMPRTRRSPSRFFASSTEIFCSPCRFASGFICAFDHCPTLFLFLAMNSSA